jgi:hypothetical protein
MEATYEGDHTHRHDSEEEEEEEEEDVIDDGFRWQKYATKQHFVKGSLSHPRFYYKCTTAGCAARKKVPPIPTLLMFTP